MEQIGNARDAAFIRDWVKENSSISGQPTLGAIESPPEGWSYKGSGTYRSVWESPDGVAYKIQHQYQGWGQNNADEYDAVAKAHELEPLAGVRLPSCSVYSPNDRPVLAMECIKGKTVSVKWDYWDLPDEIERIIEEIGDYYGLSDMHTENLMIEDETDLAVPIDFGW